VVINNNMKGRTSMRMKKRRRLAVAACLLGILWIAISQPIRAQQREVGVSIEPPTTEVMEGDVFAVAIHLDAGQGDVDSFETFLDFDPDTLAVVDPDTGLPADEIESAEVFSTEPDAQNYADNATGEIRFVGVAFPNSNPSGSFDVAYIHFRARAATPPAGTDVVFRDPIANFGGQALPLDVANGTVRILAAPVVGGVTEPRDTLQLLGPWIALVALAALAPAFVALEDLGMW
jgi:hypothetical protein